MEQRLQELEREVAALKERNDRVEADKAWEISAARKVSIGVLTYLIACCVFYFVLEDANFYRNALVPTIGYLLSTLSLSLVRLALTRRKRP